jgi:hypothetical protein
MMILGPLKFRERGNSDILNKIETWYFGKNKTGLEQFQHYCKKWF